MENSICFIVFFFWKLPLLFYIWKREYFCHAALTCWYNYSGHRNLTHAVWCIAVLVCCVVCQVASVSYDNQNIIVVLGYVTANQHSYWQNSHLQSAQHLMLNLYQKNNSSKFQWMLYFKNLSSKKMIKIPSKPIQLFTKGVWFHRSLGFSWSSREHSDPFKG